MEFFSFGNILTIVIVCLIFVINNLFLRGNKNAKLSREYSKKLKDDFKTELSSFIDEKSAGVKDDYIILNANETKAGILLEKIEKQIDVLSKQSEKIETIDSRLSGYDHSVAALFEMTNRVEENLTRIEEESAFVESAAKKINTVKEKIDQIDRNLMTMENRIKTETEEKAQQSADSVLASVRSTINGLIATSEAIEQKVDAYKQSIDAAEREYREKFDRDMATINAALKDAAQSAGAQAEKLEEGLLQTLKAQAEDRCKNAKTLMLEKIEDLQKTSHGKIDEINKTVLSARENWQAEAEQIVALQTGYAETWKNDSEKIAATLANLQEKSEFLQDTVGSHIDSIEKQIDVYKTNESRTIAILEDKLSSVAEDIQQKSLQEADARLAEYRAMQNKQFEDLEKLADDASSLDAELRKHLNNIIETSQTKFNQTIETVKTEMATLTESLAELKANSLQRVSENLKVFEENFSSDLVKRTEAVDSKFAEWRLAMTNKLGNLSETLDEEERKLAKTVAESLSQKKTELDGRLENEIEKIKEAAGSVEKNIQTQLEATDKSVKTLRQEVQAKIEEIRVNAEDSFKKESARLALQHIEKIKSFEKEIESEQLESGEQIKAKYSEMNVLMEKGRDEIALYKNQCLGEIKEIKESIDEMRRANKELSQNNEQQLADIKTKMDQIANEVADHRIELLSATDEKIQIIENAITEAQEKIQIYIQQTKVIEKTEELKNNLNRRIDDLNTEIEKIDLKRTEIADIETQIAKIKRTEDEITTKMSQFTVEQHRIERMEADFKRLLQTSKSVEENLQQVTNSDDKIQAIEVSLRKLSALMAETEEKFQKIESKNEMLGETNDAISRNFKQMQESEKEVAQCKGDLLRINAGIEDIRNNIEKLSAENEKVNATAEKIGNLDTALAKIDEHVKKVDTIRVWYADLETRLNETSKNARAQVTAINTIIEKEGERTMIDGMGSIPRGVQDQVITLKNAGWTNNEIAKNLKISIGAVELILDKASRE